MSQNVTNESRTVRIDSYLLKRIERLLKKKGKKLKYRNRQHFIDYAVTDLIEKEEKIN